MTILTNFPLKKYRLGNMMYLQFIERISSDFIVELSYRAEWLLFVLY